MKKFFLIAFLMIWAAMSAQVALDPRYHTYEEIVDEIFALQAAYPDTVMVVQIGNTRGADPYQDPMPIYAVKISANVTVDEDEPEILYLGPCHAEEILGIEVNMFMLNQILTYKNIAPFSVWLANLEIWFVPTYNPEGLQVVMDDWDETYRKNKWDNNENGIFDFVPGSGGDIDGVDPNRNYSFNWIHGEPFGVGGNEEWNDYYRGEGPFSEGETQTIRDFAADHHFMYSVAWHSSRTGYLSENVYYSFNWAGVKPCPDIDLHTSIGSNVADLILKEGSASVPYPSSASTGRKGGANDWFYKTYGTVQLLIECGTQNMQPTNDPPDFLIDDTCIRCSEGARWLMNRALSGYNNTDAAMLTGKITDAVSGDPLVARYLIDEREASFFDARFSDELYGRYWRPISTGTYTFRVFKKGYAEHSQSVTVNNSTWTLRNVQLDPLAEANVSGTINCDSMPVDGEMIIFNGDYIKPDTISFTGGNYDFFNYEGEHEVLVTSEDCVPQRIILDLTAGTQTHDIELLPAVVIFAEDWEDDLSDWTAEGDWALTSNAILGDYSVTDSPDEFYANSSTAVLTKNTAINLNGVSTDATLMFWHKYNTEHDNDFCTVEYSTNGSNWSALASYHGFTDGWKQEIIPASQLAGGFIFLRFVLTSDGSVDDPGWWIDDFKIVASTGASVIDVPPLRSDLYRNFPNPFNPSTCIKYDLASSGKVDLTIYNLKGQKVRNLVNDEQAVGTEEVIWDGSDDAGKTVASGVYLYKLKTKDFSKSRKMILIK
jgi:Zinc carboxypeptidase/FlgD Ig-like domain